MAPFIPDQVPVRPLPGDGFDHGMRFVCPACASHVWARMDMQRQEDRPFGPLPCPHCGNDIRLTVNVALRDERLAAQRDRKVRLSAVPK